MNRRVLLDTGPLVSLVNRRDRFHAWASNRFSEIEPPLLTCEAVVVEAAHLLRRHPQGPHLIFDILERGAVELRFQMADEFLPVRQLMARYSDQPMSVADACLVRMAELFAGSPIFTLDRDFLIYRMHGRKVIPTILPATE